MALTWSIAVGTLLCIFMFSLDSINGYEETCGFEDKEKRMYSCPNVEQDQEDDFDWKPHCWSTEAGRSSGPTGGYKSTCFAFIYASYGLYKAKKGPAKARMFFPAKGVPKAGKYKLDFAYHMYGRDIGELHIYKQPNNANLQQLWVKKGQQNLQPDWLTDSVETQLEPGEKIVIEAVTTEKIYGNIGIDTLKLTAVAGSSNDDTGIDYDAYSDEAENDLKELEEYDTSGISNDAVASSKVGTNFKCSFENKNWCGITQGKDNVFNWIINSGPTPSSDTGPKSAADGKSYAYMEASERKPGDKCSMTLPAVKSGGKFCLSFMYNMAGFANHMGELQVTNKGKDVWSISGVQGNDWISQEVEVNMKRGQKLVFTAIRGAGHMADIAVDKILLKQC